MSNTRLEKVLAEIERSNLEEIKESGQYIAENHPVYDRLKEIVFSEVRYLMGEVLTETEELDDEVFEALVVCLCTSFFRVAGDIMELDDALYSINDKDMKMNE